MTLSERLNIVRKVIRDHKPLFSGHIKSCNSKWDYRIIGLSVSWDNSVINRLNIPTIKYNIKVSNLRLYNDWSEEWIPVDSTYYKHSDLNWRIKDEVLSESRALLTGMFGYDKISIGTIKHIK